MEQDQLFKMIHTVEAVTNEAIIDWNTRFPHRLGISPILTLGELSRKGPAKSNETGRDAWLHRWRDDEHRKETDQPRSRRTDL